MEWDDEAIQKIRALWAEGHSTAEIGRRMGVSKNAIVGKAHRLVLPPRPSPIRRDSAAPRPPKRPAIPRFSGPTLPQMANPAPLPAPLLRAEEPRPLRPIVPVEVKPVIRPVASVGRSSSRLVVCCWPIGEPGTSEFHFCDAPALSGKPYCAAHAQVAYVKVRDRREEAA
jgi:GcrA cell cycle regulator